MNELLGEWMDVWMDEWMNEWMNEKVQQSVSQLVPSVIIYVYLSVFLKYLFLKYLFLCLYSVCIFVFIYICVCLHFHVFFRCLYLARSWWHDIKTINIAPTPSCLSILWTWMFQSACFIIDNLMHFVASRQSLTVRRQTFVYIVYHCHVHIYQSM